MRYSGIILTAALVVVTPQTTSADVVDRTPNGFTVKVVTDIAASPDAVYLALAAHLSQWWDAAHTYSGDARNLSIVAKAGGCFCEALPNRGSVEHGVVVQAQPGKLLRMRGAFGPLQEAGVSGALTFALEKTAQGTRLTLTYGAGGYYPGGLDTVAAPVDVVFTQQVTRLKDFAEKQPRR